MDWILSQVGPALQQWGTPAIATYLLVKEVFSFVKERKNGGNGVCKYPPEGCGFSASHLEKPLRELHDWNKPDPETGLFRSSEKAAEIVGTVEKVGNEIVREIRELRKAVIKNGNGG